jgi:RNA polymerase sigma-70 factor (ECF subfamily)
MSRVLHAYLEHEAALRRFLSRFLSRAQDIEDVSQEAFLKAFAAEATQPVLAPKAFLFRIAKNLALNQRARFVNSRTGPFDGGDEGAAAIPSDAPSAEDQTLAREKLALFCEAISSLPPQCRQVFLLRKVQGYSQKEIARRTGVSVSTVEKHIALGLVRCSAYLERHGYGQDVQRPVAVATPRPGDRANLAVIAGQRGGSNHG